MPATPPPSATRVPTPPLAGDLLWVPDSIAYDNGPVTKVRPYLVLNQPEPEGRRFLVIGTSRIGRTDHLSRSIILEPKNCSALLKTTAFLVDNVYQFAESETRKHVAKGTCFVKGTVDGPTVRRVLAMVKDSKTVELGIKRYLGLL